MIHAYDENYLVHSRKNLGWMLDSAVNLFGFSVENYWKEFLESGYADRFGSGESHLLCGMTGYELAVEVLQKQGYNGPFLEPEQVTDLSPEYWAGWALAHYQWYSALSFAAINEFAPISDVVNSYNPYHEMDITKFDDFMSELSREYLADCPLKRCRMRAGLSQSQLAKRSCVPLRMIQHYEQRVKNINHASAENVISIAQALHCAPAELLER